MSWRRTINNVSTHPSMVPPVRVRYLAVLPCLAPLTCLLATSLPSLMYSLCPCSLCGVFYLHNSSRRPPRTHPPVSLLRLAWNIQLQKRQRCHWCCCCRLRLPSLPLLFPTLPNIPQNKGCGSEKRKTRRTPSRAINTMPPSISRTFIHANSWKPSGAHRHGQGALQLSATTAPRPTPGPASHMIPGRTLQQ